MRGVISVGYEIPGHSDLAVPFKSDKSLLDSDIIIFCPDIEGYDTDYNNSQYQGKILYSDSGSFDLKEDTNHWKTELQISLDAGKNVFLVLNRFEKFFLHTGQKTYSGTGRNSRVTNIVTECDNYEFFPFSQINLTPTSGKEITFLGDSLFLPFWTNCKDYLEYQNYIESDIPKKLMVTKSGGKTVSGIIRVGKGNLILLPYINQPESFTKYDKAKEQTFWTKEGVEFGERLLQTILDIDKGLSGDQTPPPAWLNQDKYITEKEQILRKLVEEVNDKVGLLAIEKSNLLKAIDEVQSIKRLLYETGKPLEKIIINALEILGYKAENVQDGDLELDQVIVSPEGDRFIGEAEGKDNSPVNIDKLRQLNTNLQEDLQREEVKEIATGILFGNGFRLTDPEKRAVQFTEKCQSVASKTSIILIDTTSLYRVSNYVQVSDKPHFAKKCRETIKNSEGKIVLFPEIPTE
jgi:hypothetical protein